MQTETHQFGLTAHFRPAQRKVHALEDAIVIDYELSGSIYNSQRHIREFGNGVDKLVANNEREPGVYYALPHKHYDLDPGEIIVAAFEDDSHKTWVEKLTEANRRYQPCLWYPYKGSYYPVMFSTSELERHLKLPKIYREDVGLMHPDYAYSCTEFTDVATRTQRFHRNWHDDSATPIVTVVWHVPDEFAGCWTECRKVGDEHETSAHIGGWD